MTHMALAKSRRAAQTLLAEQTTLGARTKRKANAWRPVVLIGPDRARNQRSQTLWISSAEKSQGHTRVFITYSEFQCQTLVHPNVVLSEIGLLSLMSIEGCRLQRLLEKERIVIQEILKAAERECALRVKGRQIEQLNATDVRAKPERMMALLEGGRIGKLIIVLDASLGEVG